MGKWWDGDSGMWEKDENDQSHCIGKYDVLHQLQETVLIREKQVNNHPAQINKPEHIRENKQLVERNEIIHTAI